MTDYAAILSRKHAGREWKLEGDDYAGLTMLDDGDKPTKKSLDNAWHEVQAEIAAERQARVDARISAMAKLSALGLSDDEVNALLGA